MNKSVTAFLPCRAGSERIPNKNTKPFTEDGRSLLEIKLSQLELCELVSSIVLSTNDQKVLDLVSTLDSKKILIDIRPEHLASSSTSTDELINYVPGVIEGDHILWTHVTSPFIETSDYDAIIYKYFENIAEYDSLMTAKKVQGFIWDENNALNYDRNIEKWPRTQTLPIWYELDSGAFISSRKNYLELSDRIGRKPLIHELEPIKSIDIDWPDDFELAQKVYCNN